MRIIFQLNESELILTVRFKTSITMRPEGYRKSCVWNRFTERRLMSLLNRGSGAAVWQNNIQQLYKKNNRACIPEE